MKIRGILLWLIFLAFIVLFPITLGRINPYYIVVMSFVGIYIILAVSLDLLVGFTGQISLGHAAFFAIGAYTSGILTARYNVSPLLALGVALLLCGFIAWVLGWPVLALKGYYLAMATLALTAIMSTLITGLQWLTGGATGLPEIPPFSIFSFKLNNNTYYCYFVWANVLFVLLSCIAVIKSPLGKTLIAIHSDEIAASTLGVNCSKYKLKIFVLSSIYAALAGSLFAHYMGFLAPDDFGISNSIHILIMVYLGGVGTIFGPVLGAIFLKGIPEITYRFHDYELLVNGLMLILVLVFMPRGLVGLIIPIWQKIKIAIEAPS